jgi:uncharacterized protein
MSWVKHMTDDWLRKLSPAVRSKVGACRAILRGLGKVTVAFSGGVDSTLLLSLAVQELGRDSVLAVMASSPIHPARERQAAEEIAGQIGVALVEIATDEMSNPEFLANPPRRCYICKAHVMGPIKELAARRGLPAVVAGTNVDDLGDFRPGLEAARELGISSPLLEAGLTKQDIRDASAAIGLPTWDKPSMACLASRIPYGQTITPERLRRIEQAEYVLHDLGFGNCRVRDHDSIARIELPVGDLARALELRERIVGPIKALGYAYVSLDLQGLRSGSLNEVLANPDRKAPEQGSAATSQAGRTLPRHH